VIATAATSVSPQPASVSQGRQALETARRSVISQVETALGPETHREPRTASRNPVTFGRAGGLDT
jgi:hypothetical protein